MARTPMPPASQLIERLESVTTEHACTALAPLDSHEAENRVRVKNLLQALERTTADFVGEQAAASLRTALDRHAADLRPLPRPGCWYVVTDGSHYEHLLLPEPFPQRLLHDSQYYVRPLIQAAADHGEFLLLALSQGAVTVYRMSGDAMTAVEVEGLPAALTDVVGHERDNATLQVYHAGGAHFHGHGAGKDDHAREVEALLRAIDAALTQDPRVREEHLMIAAVDELAAAYRQISGHAHLLPCSIRLSPDKVSEETLRLAARDEFERWRTDDTTDFVRALADERQLAAARTESVLRAALEGRVDTLVVFGSDPLWGHFDEATWQMSLDHEQSTGSRDLIDLAMRATWRMGGRIRTVDAESRPTGDLGPLLARLRY